MIIQSQRLALRRVSPEDIPQLIREVFNDPEVVRHTFGRDIPDPAAAERYILENCNFDTDLGLSTLIERESGDVIGLGGPLECRYLGERDYEFGFILGRNHWGRGYATEIGRAQLDFIQHNLGASRALALASPENTGSIRTLEKLGMTRHSEINAEAERGSRILFTLDF